MRTGAHYSGEGSVLANAGSAELVAALHSVTEATDGRGRSRYPERSIKALIKAVLARRYGPPLLELCYLLKAADLIDQRHGYAGFFWCSAPSHQVDFQLRWAAAKHIPDVCVKAQEIVLTVGQNSFAISYARMPFLAILLDFLVTVLGFELVHGLVADWLAAPTQDQASASKVANKIARNLYHYLRDHLISPHQNRKLSHFVAFLKSRHGGDFQAFEIDDAAILAFWLQPPDCAEVQSDYRNFRNVMRGFIDLHRAVLQGQERLALAHGPPDLGDGTKFDADRGAFTGLPDTQTAADFTLLEALKSADCKRLKFLNKRERDDLSFVLSGSMSEVECFALTMLRGMVFGHLQNCLSQALRRGAKTSERRGILGAGPDLNYAEYIARMTQLAGHLERSNLAALDILIKAAHPSALAPILAHVHDPGWLLTALSGGRLGADPTAQFFARLQNGSIDCGLQKLLQQARLARSSVSRDGFRPAQGAEPAVIKAAAVGMAPAKRAAVQIRCHLKALEYSLPESSLDHIFDQDRRRFNRRFSDIYGITS